MDDAGFLIYKCRMCGETIVDLRVPDVNVALAHIRNSKELPWEGAVATMTGIHMCKENRIGVTDFIGVVIGNPYEQE